MPDTILVCDDEQLIRWSLSEHLHHDGFATIVAKNGAECLKAVATQAPAAVILDLKMPVMDGMTVLRTLREADNDLPVIVMTAHGGVDSAIEATRLGASGYLSKPFDLREATVALTRALSEHRLQQEVHYLRTRENLGYEEMVGKTPAMEKLFDTLRRLESVDAPTVLILGESGTGKDLVARAIHARGPRRTKPFTEIDCTALPEQLIESELFGHEKGAFTDARTTKRGLFEVASGGVIFLDEVGELPIGLQSKLLRALENRKFRRVGGVADIPLDAAIVTATNRNLRDEVKAGRFREDLFFRLNVIQISVPPLRGRVDDIPLLAQYLIERFNKTFGRHVQGMSGAAMELLKRYPWPGNVRELRNIVERTVILLSKNIIDVEDLPVELRFQARAEDVSKGCPFVLPEEGVDFDAVERGLVEQALARCGGNQTAAAKLLGFTRFAIRYRIEKYKLG